MVVVRVLQINQRVTCVFEDIKSAIDWSNLVQQQNTQKISVQLIT